MLSATQNTEIASCTHPRVRKFGFTRTKAQRYRCEICHATFSDPQPKSPLGVMRIKIDVAVKALQCLLEGCSIRSTERLTGLNRNTIMNLLVLAGEKCAAVMEAHMKNLTLKYVSDERFQITTDGFHFYERGIENIFAGQTDFAQLIKLYGDYGQHGHERYSPGRITEVISKIRDGRPDPDHISTSHIERQNLTVRMQMRRLTRLTNGFSKKLGNLQAAAALHFAYYNFCRIHASLRVTPCMETKITDRVWTLRELISN